MKEYHKDEDILEVITVQQVGEILKIGRSSVYTLLKNGKIRTVSVGNKYIIPKQSVVNFLKSAV